MAIRKNKKRFDPRYFMDEKMEEGRELHAPQYDPHQQDQWEKEQERKKKEKKDKDVPRGSEEIDYSLKEGDLSHLADPAVWEALGLAAAKMASIWVPLLGIGGLAVIIKDAIEYLKKSPESSHDDAIRYAVDNAASGEKLDENVAMAGAVIDQMKAVADPPGSFDDAAKGLYSLVGVEQIPRALQTIKDNAASLGDVPKLAKVAEHELADDELKNAIRMLIVLGKYQKEWDV